MVTTVTQDYKNIQPSLKAFIAYSIREILDDPDNGLEFTAAFKRKLHAAKRTKARGTSLAEIRKKYY